MDKLKRREFMKLVGIAAFCPKMILKAGTRPVKVFGKESMILDGKPDIKYDVEIIMPYLVYDAETGKFRKLDLNNPADISHYALRVAGVEDKENTVDWDGFEKWRAYCDKANLRVEDYTFSDKNLLDVLSDMSKEGNALMYWDGKDKGIVKVIYGLPEYLERESDRLGFELRT